MIVKPNASKTEIIGYDTTRQAFRMNVAAPADNNKANKELLKFIQKLTHMKARIASGAASKEKRIQLL